jgi:hypothetical protein
VKKMSRVDVVVAFKAIEKMLEKELYDELKDYVKAVLSEVENKKKEKD